MSPDPETAVAVGKLHYLSNDKENGSVAPNPGQIQLDLSSSTYFAKNPKMLAGARARGGYLQERGQVGQQALPLTRAEGPQVRHGGGGISEDQGRDGPAATQTTRQASQCSR